MTSDKEKAIITIANYSGLMEELIALVDGLDDDWWFNIDLPEDQQDMMGLKLKRIIGHYLAETTDIDDELNRIDWENRHADL